MGFNSTLVHWHHDRWWTGAVCTYTSHKYLLQWLNVNVSTRFIGLPAPGVNGSSLCSSSAVLRLQVWPGGRPAQDPLSLWSRQLPQVDELNAIMGGGAGTRTQRERESHIQSHVRGKYQATDRTSLEPVLLLFHLLSHEPVRRRSHAALGLFGRSRRVTVFPGELGAGGSWLLTPVKEEFRGQLNLSSRHLAHRHGDTQSPWLILNSDPYKHSHIARGVCVQRLKIATKGYSFKSDVIWILI